MKFKSYKSMALVTSAILLGSLPTAGYAADNADVTVDIETQAGITAVKQTDMNFGSWLIGVHPADTPTVVMAAATGNFSTTTGTGSQLINLTGATSGIRGTVLVTLPTGANGLTMQMSRGAITDFGTSLSLGTITYINSDNALQTGTLLAADPGKPITITTGATGATVSFGGTVTASATPAGVGTVHTASFNVSFAY